MLYVMSFWYGGAVLLWGCFCRYCGMVEFLRGGLFLVVIGIAFFLGVYFRFFLLVGWVTVGHVRFSSGFWFDLWGGG